MEIINEKIPQRGNREISVGEFITVGAINRAINPCSKNGIGKWMNKTVLPRLIGSIDAFTSCQIPQRGKPKKGGKEQRLVGREKP